MILASLGVWLVALADATVADREPLKPTTEIKAGLSMVSAAEDLAWEALDQERADPQQPSSASNAFAIEALA